MGFDETVKKAMQWGLTAESLGALGAYLTLIDGEAGEAGVRERLRSLTAAAGLPDLAELEPPQRAMIAGLARSSLKQALDLLEEPERGPGWAYTDPGVLDGWGRGSAAVPGMISAVLPEISDVQTLLDVGTGVGLLAVGATNVWKDVTVVGIDTWEPSLDRARKHVADAGLTERVELRNQNVVDLSDVDRFDCAWVPTFFLPEQLAEAAVAAVVRSVKPGGWVVLGRFLPMPDPVADAMLQLRTYRFGGCLLDEPRSVELLEGAGCTSVRVAPAPPPVQMAFTVGQKPGA
jgi:2-polyprenyl-3-methyl-5-hydroxy-6-metoxy-1,4-benzoquinol methylase